MLITRGEYCWLANCRATREIEKTIARKDSTELAIKEETVIPMLAMTHHHSGISDCDNKNMSDLRVIKTSRIASSINTNG
jgi:hypothetical protein